MFVFRVGVVIAALSLSQLTLANPSAAEDLVPDAPISGTVVSADGAALSGVIVEAVSPTGTTTRVVTTATGAYRLDVPDGEYTLSVTPPSSDLSGLSTVGVEAPRNWPLDFSLSRKTVGRVFVTGDVTFSTGAPITSGSALFAGAGTSINRNGFFSSATIPGTSGNWTLNARGATGTGSEMNFFANGGPRTTIQQDTYIDFVIPTTTTHVTVKDASGNPLAGSLVRINSGGFGLSTSRVEVIANESPFNASWTATARTDSQGILVLPRPTLFTESRITLMVDAPTSAHLPHSSTPLLPTVAGEFTVTLTPRASTSTPTPTPTLTPTSTPTAAPTSTPAPTPTQTPTPTPSPTATTPAATPTPVPSMISLSGAVTLSNGQPVPGVVVVPVDPSQRVNGGNSADGLGRYSVLKPSGFSGSWQLSCRAQSSLTLPDHLCFTLTGGDVIRRDSSAQVNFSVPSNLYRIRVLDESGMPVSNARVQVRVADEDPRNAAIVDLLPGQAPFIGSWRGFDVTGSDGWAQVPGLRMTNVPMLNIDVSPDSASRHEGKSIQLLASALSDTVIVVGFKPSRISSISPSRVEPGQEFLISGENLLGASSVRIGNASAVFTVESNTLIRVITPGNAATGSVEVTTASGTTTYGSSITVLPTALGITTNSLATGQVGSPFSETLSATGGVAPYRWRIQGTRPSGLSLTTQGVLQGTPLRVMNSSITVSVTDATGKTVMRNIPLTIQPKPLTLPGAVSAVSGQGAAQRISLSWKAPSDDGGNPITGYRIEYSVNAGVTWQLLVANTRSRTAGSSFAFQVGTSAVFRVAAINSLGAGPFDEDAVSPTLTAYGPASAPRDVSVSSQSGFLKVEWNAPVTNNGALITGYRIRISTNGRTWSTVVNDTRSTALTSLVQQRTGRNYWVQVSAINAGGISPYATVTSPVYLSP